MPTSDPWAVFAGWYAEAEADTETTAEAVTLATATKAGRPSARMVLYRGIREGGLSFFTNYKSRKGIELEENPFAAMVFFWPLLGRQVRIEGRVERLSISESDGYFASRPFESQITAVLSLQSRPVEDPAELLSKAAQLGRSLRGQTIPRPDEWGGFKLLPDAFEFWSQGKHRRHQRFRYEQIGTEWRETRLYP